MSDSVNISSSSTAEATAPAATTHEMHGHGSGGTSDVWLHNLEATASLTIASGTLIAACGAHGALPSSAVSEWIVDCLVPFQLPIFYFCLGFLYQRYRTTRTKRTWAANLRRELALMGIPFVAFTILVLLTNSLTGGAPPFTIGTLVESLFVTPVVPVGYFYTCLIIYAVTPTVKSRRNARGLIVAAALAKVTIVVLLSLPATASFAEHLPYALTSVAENWLWAAGGMAVALYRGLPILRGREKVWALGALWIAASIVTFRAGWIGEASHAVLDGLGVLWCTSLFATVFRGGRQNRFFGFVTRYTMAIWLFHGMFLALYFHLLAIAGFTASATPGLAGLGALVVCYGAPVLVMGALSHLGKTGVIVYPARYLPPTPTAIIRKTPR
ncbi:acyltransferase family protein [Adlercreutzia sp. R25]|uniref:Acyltransferase family protein n=2 Tax=Adlercreutzia shanghongiae TaxID=3111773 RepID=A0ABU6IYV3_9ACTN|nr:acyltransferase family protein [Adlercreutzia sp. R25]MEC4272840.1 acyltransferase family protein [Adlercreutzia sp. R25]MEC4295046.1 acyltransferase family protein [Adlercreutzia sp. R22]